MKFRPVIFILYSLCFVSNLIAEEIKPATKSLLFSEPPEKPAPKQIASGGVNNFGSVILESLQTAGLVKLNGTTVTGPLNVVGSLITNGATLNALEVSGEANLSNTTVTQSSSIVGSMQAVRSTFLQSISILTQKAVFTSSRLKSVTFRQDSAFKGKQILELKQGTVVDGPIHFESGKGEVILFPGCQVLGPVTGGKVIRKSQ